MNPFPTGTSFDIASCVEGIPRFGGEALRCVEQGPHCLDNWADKAQGAQTVLMTLGHSMRTCLALLRPAMYAAALAAVSLSAQAAWPPALPDATLSFSTPSGTAGPNDAIEVWLDFKVSAGGPALVFNADAFLVSPDVPTMGAYTDVNGQQQEAAFTSYSYASFGSWFGCSGTFTSGCTDGPPYSFTFASGLNDFYDVGGTLTIDPGQSVHYLFGTFDPSAGPVDPGTYSFYRATIGLYVTGLGVDPAGDSVNLYAVTFPYLTCSDNDASCAFTRTVGAVPEPAGYAMMLAGLAGLGAVGLLIRRRRKA